MKDTTITAIATPAGVGAIAVIRLSGSDSINICEKIFSPTSKQKKLSEQPAYTIHHGKIYDGGKEIDQVLVSLFKAPNSYTGEDIVEISCHGSILIQQQILELLIKNGATMAQPGEFTLRAFLNGKMDLSQAEGVADLIASNSEAARRVAMNQMRGGFSDYLKRLREQLVHFISLIELELDFSEEDVEFADRTQLIKLVNEIASHIKKLLGSFKLGNVIKNGVPVTIAGKPNVGKSTLLNKILNEEKAIVSDIAGTTRDSIEDTVNIKGINFRFIDTAGLRLSTDKIETLGIERTYIKISQALIILMMADARDNTKITVNEIQDVLNSLKENQQMVVLINKVDMVDNQKLNSLQKQLKSEFPNIKIIAISAKHGLNMEELHNELTAEFSPAALNSEATIVTNIRHYQSLLKAQDSLARAKEALQNNIPTDLLAMDIRQVLYYIGEITGEITTDEILGSIFSKFCIGK
ncbi:MAG: tRNA uridine-5-carboxymethylaminomethyl(34) synthesis GTPase MnmE [Bacteroidales bacterium]